MKNYQVSELQTSVPAGEYVSCCVDVEKFLSLCKQCPNYGKIWACPPFDFDPLTIWNSYDVLELHGRILTPGENMSQEELMEAFRREKLLLSSQVLRLEKQIPGSLSLAASTCIACSPCLRSQGKPCCHREILRPSIEALGGDVCLTASRYLNHPIRWMEAGKLPPYLTLMAGLLRKNGGK